MRFGALCVMAALFLGAEITSAAPPKAGAKPFSGLVRLPAPPPAASARFHGKFLAAIGDWEVNEVPRYATAFTANESGSEFGFICGEKCRFYFDLEIDCDERVAYPAAIDGPQGHHAITLRCKHFGTSLPLLSVEGEAKPMFDLLRQGSGLVAVSVPLESGPPEVALFSLAGGAEAVRQAADHAGVLHGAR